MTGIVLIDLEASGLYDGSYPTEVGWCSHDLHRGASFLVQPTPGWLELPWSAEAEAITGISLDMLLAHGQSPQQVAECLNEALAGTAPLTDAPWQDGRWLRVLHAAAGIPPSYGICPPPPAEPGWQAQMTWGQQKAPHDLDAWVTRIAHEGRLSAEAVEMETKRLHQSAGLVEHRALDDAIGHALQLGLVTVWSATSDAASRRAALDDLVQRARALLASVPRPGR